MSAFTAGNLTLWAGGQLAASWPVCLYSGQAFRVSWARPPEMDGVLGLRLENINGAVVAQTGQAP